MGKMFLCIPPKKGGAWFSFSSSRFPMVVLMASIMRFSLLFLKTDTYNLPKMFRQNYKFSPLFHRLN